MKSSIKILKRNRDEDSNDLKTSEGEKSVEQSTREMTSTVKRWIAEIQQRKRAQGHSLSRLPVLILIAFISVLIVPAGNSGRPNPGKSQAHTPARALTPGEPDIKVTIATVGGLLGPPTNQYKVGDQIPVTITMTNTSTGPLSVCISSDLYQNLPKLTKDGELVPYMKWQSHERLSAQRNQTCKEENLPEPVLLRPNEPNMADLFVLVDSRTSTGAEAWYDSLPPGKYELSIQRRLACCDGPMFDSNKISFEVVP